MPRRNTVLFGFALLAAAFLFQACADDPLDAVDHHDHDHEELSEYWEIERNVDDTAFKQLTTVNDLVASRACSTASTQGLNRQIAEELNCMSPGMFSSIQDIPNVRLGPGANPFLQNGAASALKAAASRNPNTTLHINSSWRSVVQQYVLKRWEGSCGIGVAARPGRSQHESGLALDTNGAMPNSLRAQSWSWYCDRTNRGRWNGCRDTPHWDYRNGTDLRSAGVKAFQRLWNRANPNDKIAEDGAYGPQTEARLRRSPLAGFSTGTTCNGAVAQTEDPDVPVPTPRPDENNDPNPSTGGEEASILAMTKDVRGESSRPARVWRPTVPSLSCGGRDIPEDFSSGRFNMHRYRVTVENPGALSLKYTKRSGSFSPALYVLDQRGVLVFAGDAEGGHPSIQAEIGSSGRNGESAEVTLRNLQAGFFFVFVTSWETIDSGMSASIPRSARYNLTLEHICETPSAASVHNGIDADDLSIPREGLRNATLLSVHGISREPHGAVQNFEGSSYVSGKVSWFGGPNDTGVSQNETGTLTGERLRSLNNPLRPTDAVLASNKASYYYIAMRWDYSPRGKAEWRNRRMVVVNPRTGARVVVRPVDWGPNVNTGRVMDLSPQVMDDLGLTTDETALVAFVSPSTPLGPLR